ncbi:MAG: fuconate dehydratase [Verrucomicrobiales bacterium]|nr:fuconate dehydratase [Verrucomicrobiales bacterium]
MPAPRLQIVEILDLRFPTSTGRHGSDAMNPDPDYSAAYVVLGTGTDDGPLGHGLAFTIGRGNDVVCEAIRALQPRVEGWELEAVVSDMAGFWRHLNGDSQLRWLGPDKGVIHLASAALMNAVWDLWAKREGKPLWKLVVDLTPRQLVGCVDFRYLSDALTREEALALLEQRAPAKAAEEARVRREGVRAYTTSAGWLGYSDAEIRRRCRDAVAEGWEDFKIKVGRDPAEDARRAALVREEIGPRRRLMIDANQVWDVPQAIASVHALSRYDLAWVEEPTSPDDILGHAAIARAVTPIRVATGEHCANAVMFKQFFQADALQVCQLDACRLAGVNECLAVMLLAAKFGVPVCPHAGGVGLCEHVQHLALIDAVAVGGPRADRVVEFVDHLHEHFVDPVRLVRGAYQVPERPGYSTEIRAASRERYRFPRGAAWDSACPLS